MLYTGKYILLVDTLNVSKTITHYNNFKVSRALTYAGALC